MGCKEHPFSKQSSERIPLPDLPLWVSGTAAPVLGRCRTPWPAGPGFLLPVARIRAAVPDSRAGSRPGTRMQSAGCGLARYHPSARSEEMTTAWLLARFPWEIATAWAEIPILGTVGWGACPGETGNLRAGGVQGAEGVCEGMRRGMKVFGGG